jgi:hypothetical protein
MGLDPVLLQEAGQLAHRNGEVEGRIGAVVADRAEGIDPTTRPQASSSGPPEFPAPIGAVCRIVSNSLELRPAET